MKKMCENCRHFRRVEDWYYDECMAGPMAVEPKDPACCMYQPLETKPIDKSKIQTLIDKFKSHE